MERKSMQRTHLNLLYPDSDMCLVSTILERNAFCLFKYSCVLSNLAINLCSGSRNIKNIFLRKISAVLSALSARLACASRDWHQQTRLVSEMLIAILCQYNYATARFLVLQLTAFTTREKMDKLL